MAVRKTGTVKALKEKEGYGFIQDLSGVDYFFHHTDADIDLKALKLNQTVTFEPVTSPKGPRAIDVQVPVVKKTPVAKEKVLPGPVSIFRGKVRKPVTLTLIPEHHVMVNRAMRRLGLSRADTVGLLIDQYADVVEC